MHEASLTKGNIYTTMIKFAIPFLLANLLQALYGAADLLIVGWFSDSAGLSAVATGSQILQTLTCTIVGLATGGTVLIGRFLGMGREEDVKQTIGTMLTLFAILAAALTALLLVFARPVVSLMQAPPEAFDQTVQYTFLCGCGVFFIFGYNAISAVLRGMGDSKNPLLFVAIACVCNILGDLILVGGLHLGAAGAAIATTGSQGISMVLAVIFLKRRGFLFDFRLKSFGIRRDKAAALLKLGLPIALQESLVMLSFLFITAIVNQMGVAASAAIGVTEKINLFTLLPPTAFSSAIAAMVAQNMGAGETGRSRRYLRIGILFSLVFGVTCFVWLQLSPQSAMGIFTTDQAVVAAGSQYLRAFSIDCILVCFMFCLNGFFNGCGHSAFSMANNLLSTFLVRVPVAWLFSRIAGATLFEIGLAAPLASAVSIVIAFVYLRTGKWKKLGHSS